ncbi:MAG: Uma2 family endonuclease [Spirosomaceae bacterium]|jgi:Uma2 family endonuclease|nr:Uma2 family endonuclease [Spirosomataceae bacterium]
MVIIQDLRTELLERLKTEELVRVPASEADYLALAQHFPFKVEYHQSEIYTMGLASFYHELIAAMFTTILNNLFMDKDDYIVLGSNSGVQIPKFEGSYFMPDVTVVKGEPIFKPNSTAIITNPYLIVEILSPATDKFDKESKLPEYKHLQSLQQIIMVNPRRVGITSYIRTEQPNTWLNQDFYDLEESLLIDGQPVTLASIYKKVKFE